MSGRTFTVAREPNSLPSLLRHQVLTLAHEGHPDMSVMKSRLRTKVWRPRIDREVEKFVKECRGCQIVSLDQLPEPMKRRQLPNQPWVDLAIDFKGPLPSRHYILVVIDYYSRYFEVKIMTKIDSEHTISVLREIFARFGIPRTITSDNGPQFISEEFKKFMHNCNIRHFHTVPYWPQQNGEVERQNRSLLKRLQISQNLGSNWQEDLSDYLLMYRSTVHTVTGKTPSELMFGRNIRDKLPYLESKVTVDEEVRERDQFHKEKGKEYANKRRRAMEQELEIGDTVLMKNNVKSNGLSSNFHSQEFLVTGAKDGGMVVQDKQTGKVYRRKKFHLKKIPASVGEQARNGDEPIIPRRPKRNVTKPSHLGDYVCLTTSGGKQGRDVVSCDK